MRQVPASLFEDADEWNQYAKEKLDKFEAHAGDENFINYDMLESKSQDIVQTGELMMTELDKHKDVSFPAIKTQISQLGLKFDTGVCQ